MRIAVWSVVLVACANANPDQAALAIDPDAVELHPGESATLHATSERAAVSDVAWDSADPSIATVVPGNDGEATVTGVAAGETMILVRLGTFRRSVVVEVSDAVVDRVDVTAEQPMVPLGLHTQLVAKAHFTDGTTIDMTDKVAWASADKAIASVAPGGSVTAIALGTTDVTATFIGATGKISIEVTAAKLTQVDIAQVSPIAKGLHAQLAATGTYSDGSTMDVTSAVTWSAADPAVATVDAAGVLHAVAVGSTEIDAALDGATGAMSLEVGPAVPDHLVLSSGDFTLAQHQRAHLHARLVLTDATVSDVTAGATWDSDAPTVATASGGQIDAQTTASSATITATANGVSASVRATVSAASCHPVINEVQAAGASSSDEWVELYNPCTVAMAVAGWSLVYRSSGNVGATDTDLLATLAGTMAAGELRLYAGPGFAGGNDGQWGGGTTGLLSATNGGIGLRSGPKDTGPLVDAVAYGTLNPGHPFVEGTPAPALATRKSIARMPFDGNDTNEGGTDFVLVTSPTPRALNAP